MGNGSGGSVSALCEQTGRSSGCRMAASVSAVVETQASSAGCRVIALELPACAGGQTGSKWVSEEVGRERVRVASFGQHRSTCCAQQVIIDVGRGQIGLSLHGCTCTEPETVDSAVSGWFGIMPRS